MRAWQLNRRAWALLVALAVIAFSISAADAPIRIGVLANRGNEEALRRWQPTADYLNLYVQGTSFVIVPLDFEEVFKTVERGDVDFVIANSGNYVEMEVRFGVSRIVTLKNLRNGVVCKYFGGVIFTRADRTDIQSIKDLKGKTFLAVDERSLGGWQMAWREIKEEGLDPYKDFASLKFSGTHDPVVYAVRDGKVDAGTVRTDLFERVASEGKIDLTQFRILNSKPKTSDFPFMRSTRLYPEWPMAKLRHTSDDVAQRVASALLNMPADSAAAKACESAGWTVPLDYSTVHECYRELRISPYENYGQITLADVFREYRWWLFSLGISMAALVVYMVRHRRLNQRLLKAHSSLEAELAERRRAEARLQAAQAELEARVVARTAELAGANEGLRAEIAERGRALAALNASEQRFRQLAENIRQVFWINNLEKTEMYYVSPAYQEIFGRPVEELYSNPRSFINLIHPEDREAVVASLPSQVNGIWEQEYRVIHADGVIKWVRATGFPVRNEEGKVYRIAGLVEDITERRMLEQQFAQAQKMEAVGQLSGGIAHDFNNLLTVIAACCDQIALTRNDAGAVSGHVDMIQETVQRGAALTRQLLTFSRRQVLTPKILSLNAVVQGMAGILRRLMGETVDLQLALDPQLGHIRADAGQIEQVLMNLCVNARDAMPKGGTLSITTQNFDPTGKESAGQPESSLRGPHVLLRIADSGVGIDPAIQSRIFEPFFTTKKQGQGTGLGLPTVYGIVRQSGGLVRFESQPGRGTTFFVYLAQVPMAVDQKQDSGVALARPGQETILLAEDDETVRGSVSMLLRMRGYTVLPAINGADAWRIFQEQRKSIQLVLTDMMMPAMGGWELSQRVLELQPDASIIFMSGHTPDAAVRDAIHQKGMVFVQKPFTHQHLESKIREVLDIRCQSGT